MSIFQSVYVCVCVCIGSNSCNISTPELISVFIFQSTLFTVRLHRLHCGRSICWCDACVLYAGHHAANSGKKCFFLQIQLAYLLCSRSLSLSHMLCLFHHFSSLIFPYVQNAVTVIIIYTVIFDFFVKAFFNRLPPPFYECQRKWYCEKQIRFLNKNPREPHSFQFISMRSTHGSTSKCSRFRCYLFERSARN